VTTAIVSNITGCTGIQCDNRNSHNTKVLNYQKFSD